jgi:hypothetical protein
MWSTLPGACRPCIIAGHVPLGGAVGVSTVYVRNGQEGRSVRIHFCPTCGTSVYWEADARSGMIGVALGAFADPSFPKPSRSAWEQTRHPWVGFEHEVDHFEHQPPTAAAGAR